MHKTRSVIVGLLAITLSLGADVYLAASGPRDGALVQPTAQSGSGSSVRQAASVPSATLRAASGATTRFRTQNGETIDGAAAQILDLPHLVLARNGALTDPDERTLIVELTGIPVPPAGVLVTLDVVTQHGDPDAGGDTSVGVPVWHASRWITNTQTGTTVVFTHEFTETVVSGTETTATPTDYFRYDIAVTDAQHPSTDPWHTLRQDYAFLMESQWVARLPEVQVAKPARVIGTDTVSAMQSGIYWGYVGLIEGIVARIRDELAASPKVVATGGLAHLYAQSTGVIEAVDVDLTLHGLRLVWERNRG